MLGQAQPRQRLNRSRHDTGGTGLLSWWLIMNRGRKRLGPSLMRGCYLWDEEASLKPLASVLVLLRRLASAEDSYGEGSNFRGV